jgi:diguanylate cyclase (GGDEF)-like protein
MEVLEVSATSWLAWAGLAMGLASSAVCARLFLSTRRLKASLRQAEDAHRRLVDVDALTGAASPTTFDRALAAATARADRGDAAVSVVYVGLDDLRHAAHDVSPAVAEQVLVEVANRLQTAGGTHGCVARLGVDEFALLAHGPAQAGKNLSRKVLALLEPSFDVDTHTLQLSVSVGYAVYPDHGASTRIVRLARSAMLEVRRAGGGAFAEFEPRLAEAVLDEAALLKDLRNAIEQRELSLYYQPKVDATSLEVTAAEALVRWQHPLRGMVSPAVFIPLAERSGLIEDIGRWVMEEALAQAARWAELGLRMRVAINVSGQQMRSGDFVERLAEGLARHQLKASRFTCEITETVAMEDIAATKKAFARLGELGVHVSIDDFGTGHSSLAQLRKLPAAELKIDRAFVTDLDSSESARSIASAIVHMAHSLGLRVVAEGVETEAQRDVLMTLGCDEMQGFLFGKPMTAAALGVWAMDDHSGPSPIGWRSSLFKATLPFPQS